MPIKASGGVSTHIFGGQHYYPIALSLHPSFLLLCPICIFFSEQSFHIITFIIFISYWWLRLLRPLGAPMKSFTEKKKHIRSAVSENLWYIMLLLYKKLLFICFFFFSKKYLYVFKIFLGLVGLTWFSF